MDKLKIMSDSEDDIDIEDLEINNYSDEEEEEEKEFEILSETEAPPLSEFSSNILTLDDFTEEEQRTIINNDINNVIKNNDINVKINGHEKNQIINEIIEENNNNDEESDYDSVIDDVDDVKEIKEERNYENFKVDMETILFPFYIKLILALEKGYPSLAKMVGFEKRNDLKGFYKHMNHPENITRVKGLLNDIFKGRGGILPEEPVPALLMFTAIQAGMVATVNIISQENNKDNKKRRHKKT